MVKWMNARNVSIGRILLYTFWFSQDLMTGSSSEETEGLYDSSWILTISIESLAPDSIPVKFFSDESTEVCEATLSRESCRWRVGSVFPLSASFRLEAKTELFQAAINYKRIKVIFQTLVTAALADWIVGSTKLSLPFPFERRRICLVRFLYRLDYRD